MRRKSKKTAAVDRAIAPERKAFGREMKFCACCTCSLGCDVHEIARGGSRAKAKLDRRAWLWVCRECHDALGNYVVWPIARQCAAKLVSDPEHFDLKAICRLRGRAETDCTLADVAVYLEVTAP